VAEEAADLAVAEAGPAVEERADHGKHRQGSNQASDSESRETDFRRDPRFRFAAVLGRRSESREKAFVRLGMSATKDRNAVLFFVVPARRKFVVLGDSGIHEKVGEEFWRHVVRTVSGSLRKATLRADWWPESKRWVKTWPSTSLTTPTTRTNWATMSTTAAGDEARQRLTGRGIQSVSASGEMRALRLDPTQSDSSIASVRSVYR